MLLSPDIVPVLLLADPDAVEVPEPPAEPDPAVWAWLCDETADVAVTDGSVLVSELVPELTDPDVDPDSDVDPKDEKLPVEYAT